MAQTIEASGLTASASGKKYADVLMSDLSGAEKQAYSADARLDTLADDAGQRKVA